MHWASQMRVKHPPPARLVLFAPCRARGQQPLPRRASAYHAAPIPGARPAIPEVPGQSRGERGLAPGIVSGCWGGGGVECVVCAIRSPPQLTIDRMGREALALLLVG